MSPLIVSCLFPKINSFIKYMKEGNAVELIRNSAEKVICGADANEKSVEIICKGTRTLIRFNNDGTLEVVYLEPKTT